MGNDIEAAVRSAFVAHMATVDVTDVKWLDEIGPVGERDNYAVLLATEWERFDAGYRAALARPAAPATAIEEARRVFCDASFAAISARRDGGPDAEDGMNAPKPVMEKYRALLAAERGGKGAPRG